MKKLVLFYLFIMASFLSQAQQWKPYKIDDSVQVSLPSQKKITDTLGQKIISASSPFGTVLIIKTPDNPARTPDIEKEKHLNNFYQEYLQKIRKSTAGGIVSDEKDTIISNLKYKDFTLEVDSGTGKQYRNFRVVHVNSATYTFEFLYQDLHQAYAEAEKDKFFNSIKIPPEIGLQSQFTVPGSTTGEPPSGNKLWFTISIILTVIILAVIVFLIRRTRSNKKLNRS